MKPTLGPSAGLLMLCVASAAMGQVPDHVFLQRDTAAGRVLPLPEILQRLRAQTAGLRHIGSEYDPRTRRYRLKYLREGQVVWIDVDAASGRVLGRASP
ncbi:PepSY domain-containing protein [Sphingosinicella terrae]|uniref:PepSY domain-containing protein n=1 Tax=Sphingosinicella terrae TaxID=2172047 RepID=UPI000E0CBFFF|nr:PepSY domain-containing protein [Sphingosinicella terrae]